MQNVSHFKDSIGHCIMCSHSVDTFLRGCCMGYSDSCILFMLWRSLYHILVRNSFHWSLSGCCIVCSYGSLNRTFRRFSSAVNNPEPKQLFQQPHILGSTAIKSAFVVASILLAYNRVQLPDSSVQSTSRGGVVTKLQSAIPNGNGIFYSIWYIVGLGVLYQFVALEENFISDLYRIQDEVSMDWNTWATMSNGLVIFEWFVHKLGQLACHCHANRNTTEHRFRTVLLAYSP